MDRAGETSRDDRTATMPTLPSRPGPRSRRRRVLVVGLAAVAGLLVAGLLVPTSVVDRLADRSVARLGGNCSDLIGVDVHTGSWPVTARLLAGRYEQISADIDEVRLHELGLSYHDVTFTASRIDIGALGGLLGDDVRIHDGTTTATLRFDTIESALADHGITAELSELAGSVRAEILLPPFGELPTTVHVAAVGGEVELQFVPLDLVTLPPLRIALPAPAALQSLLVDQEGVHVEATIDGALPTDDFSCEL